MPDGPHYEFTSVGDVEEILSRDEAEGLLARANDEPQRNRAVSSPALRVESIAGRFRFAHAESDVKQGRGELLRPTHAAKIVPYGKPMFAGVERMPDEGNAELVVREADFDFITDAIGTVFSGGDRSDTSPDVPVATEEASEFHTWTDATGVEWSTNPAGNEQFAWTMDPPNRARELTLHIQADPIWEDTDEIRCYVRFGHGHGTDGENNPVTTRGYQNIDGYRATGGSGQIFMTTDIPSNEEMQIVVEYIGGTSTERGVRINALAR